MLYLNKNLYKFGNMERYMQKRGQVSVFAIVGVTLVILVALFFFLRNQYGIFISPVKFLDDKAKPIEDNLKECVNKVVSASARDFLKQGGDNAPNSFRLYQGKAVKYYCTNIPDQDQCLNVMPVFGDIVSDLNDNIQVGVNNCIDQDLIKGGLGYKIEAGSLTTETTASGPNLLVRANYDVDITKGDTKSSIRGVTVNFDIPLEELYVVAVDIVNAEASVGLFEQLLYMVNERGQYIINLDKPYPDKIYKINKKDNGYELWFAVEGERG